MAKLLNKKPILALLLLGAFISAPGFTEPTNLSLVKKEIKSYHDSGLYQKELAQAIAKAQRYIISQAMDNEKNKKHQKLAIILDIDETSLSNYKHMIERDFTGTREQFHQDVMAADAPAIEPTLALYKEAKRHGVNVFFVTGRPESERKATEENLTKAGYAGWKGLYLKPRDYQTPSIIPFKTHAREIITHKGYTIVATIGDQYSDLKGGYAEKGFKLPNPYYYLP